MTRTIPAPKKGLHREINNFRPVALTSHEMKILERLIIHILKMNYAQDPLQFVHLEKVGVEDAALFLLHLALFLTVSYSDVRMPFFEFLSSFQQRAVKPTSCDLD